MRLVVLTSSRFGTASNCLPALAAANGCQVVHVILSEGKRPNLRRRVANRLRKVGRIGVLGALNGVRMRRWYSAAPSRDLFDVCKDLGIPVSVTETTNGKQTRQLLAAANADLGVSLGNSYISARVFSIPRLGMINLHGERLPEYRNAQSVIWPIFNGERTTGLSVHQVDKGIDTGGILYKEEFPIVFRPRLAETVMATLEVTRARVPAAVAYVCENYQRLRAEVVPQSGGRSYTTPSIREFIRMTRNNRALAKPEPDANPLGAGTPLGGEARPKASP